jgi:hypothetical protein
MADGLFILLYFSIIVDLTGVVSPSSPITVITRFRRLNMPIK